MISSYEEAMTFINAQLPNFSTMGSKAIKKGLGNINALCEHLNMPHQQFRSVHVAGTNGKGSVSHILAATFHQAGYKTGLYTSPHLVDLRERFKINGKIAPTSFVVNFLNQNKEAIQKIQPSYFEINVAMAFAYFAQEKVDIAIIETGLGGRKDSTNVIVPDLSVITNIGMDHVDVLGNTLEAIAKEKAGIIKEGVPVVIGETDEMTEQVFFLDAHSKKAAIHKAETVWEVVRTKIEEDKQRLKAVNKANMKLYEIETDLMGDYQLKNIRTSLMAVNVLEHLGWKISTKDIIDSLSKIKKQVSLRGRWEIIQQLPKVILDVGHNPPGLEYLKDNLANELKSGEKLHIVMGFAKDKDVDSILDYFPLEANFYFSQAQVPRAMEYQILTEKALRKGLEGTSYSVVSEAIEAAFAKANANDTILITGSFFIVGEAIQHLELRKKIEKHYS